MEDLPRTFDLTTSLKKFGTVIWDKYGSFLWNLFLILLLEIVVNLEGILSILFTIWQTIGFDILLFITVLYVADKIYIRLCDQFNVPGPAKYSVTWVDRGLAVIAIIWPMSELFMYFGEIVDSFDFLSMIEHDYLRGIIFFLSFAPFNNAIISILVFRELIRRRGPDTKWFGQYSKVWIKHFVRYHWCFAFCIHIMIQLFMYIFIKFAVASGLEGENQESVALCFFFMMLGLMVYAGISAILGVQCRFPLFHGACLLHCGRLKNSKDD